MKVLIVFNSSTSLYNFKKEFIEELISPNTYLDNNKLNPADIYICVPDKKMNLEFEKLGCSVVNISMDRRGTNPFKDIKLFFSYIKILKNIKPDFTFLYTIKPNVYGGLACQLTKSSYLTNVTGLGTSIRSRTKITPLINRLYKYGSLKSKVIYFENKSDMKYFNKFIYDNDVNSLMPGSGVNLDKFKFKEYPHSDRIKFIAVTRVMKDKGIEEFLEASKIIKSKYKNIDF